MDRPLKKRQKRPDLTCATYLDDLGAESARAYTVVIGLQAAREGISLPLDDDNLGVLLDNTIKGLQQQRKLDWNRTPPDRRSVFIAAWTREMDRLGIRSSFSTSSQPHLDAPPSSTDPTRSKTQYVCSRIWKPGLVYFVREHPGEGGADWGYVDNPGKARPLSHYWMRRFVADMRRVGAVGVDCSEVSVN